MGTRMFYYCYKLKMLIMVVHTKLYRSSTCVCIYSIHVHAYDHSPRALQGQAAGMLAQTLTIYMRMHIYNVDS